MSDPAKPPPTYPYMSGVLWDKFFHRAVLTYVSGDLYALVVTGRHRVGFPIAVLALQHDAQGRYLWPVEELPEVLKDWRAIGYSNAPEYWEPRQPEQSA